jgi:nitrite reductase/ring-hydroxylating ferredoxin subunit/uncharacterized membrane protein
MSQQIMNAIEGQEWLAPVEEAVQGAVNSAFEAGGTAGKKVQNALNGKWLGHALHPALTDIPVGAWTAALVLDCMEARGGTRKGFGDAADATVAIGLCGAVGAAVTGLTDWKDMDGGDRRAGLVHGLLNTVVAGLYAGSLVARRKGDRGTGRVLGALGWGAMLASAWIGGDLVSRKRAGVDRSSEVELPLEWIPLMRESSLPEDQLHRAEHQGVRVLLVRRGNSIFAIGETCSHRCGPLAEGKLDGDCVTCPWHGSVFSIKDGSVVDGPATQAQPQFEVRVRDGLIEVRAAAQ